ncbi:MAG: TolB family protein, partial [Vicinamibacterales bacterium]
MSNGLALAAACLAPLLTLLSAQRASVLVLSHLTWFDRAGSSLGRLGPLADHGNIELSPDGSRVAVAVTDRGRGTRDIWMYRTADGRREQFTADPADENWLIWSPDGSRVAINSFSRDGIGLFEAPAAGSEPRSALVSHSEGIWPVSWSPNGQFILYVTNSRETSNDVWV